jgi:hypothetical protein
MNERIKAGAEIHSGDGGYSVGTQEKYNEFVKNRNRSMNNRIKELQIQAEAAADEIFDRKGKMHDEIVMEKFAELIVRECVKVAMKSVSDDEPKEAWYLIQEHFGIE